MLECYAAIRKCGCMVEYIIDDGDDKRHVAKQVHNWIRRGDIVQRVTLAEAEENVKECRCEEIQAAYDVPSL